MGTGWGWGIRFWFAGIGLWFWRFFPNGQAVWQAHVNQHDRPIKQTGGRMKLGQPMDGRHFLSLWQ
jgi:hypothetical protein